MRWVGRVVVVEDGMGEGDGGEPPAGQFEFEGELVGMVEAGVEAGVPAAAAPGPCAQGEASQERGGVGLGWVLVGLGCGLVVLGLGLMVF